MIKQIYLTNLLLSLPLMWQTITLLKKNSKFNKINKRLPSFRTCLQVRFLRNLLSTQIFPLKSRIQEKDLKELKKNRLLRKTNLKRNLKYGKEMMMELTLQMSTKRQTIKIKMQITFSTQERKKNNHSNQSFLILKNMTHHNLKLEDHTRDMWKILKKKTMPAIGKASSDLSVNF